jgi:hypothetical protein
MLGNAEQTYLRSVVHEHPGAFCGETHRIARDDLARDVTWN